MRESYNWITKSLILQVTVQSVVSVEPCPHFQAQTLFLPYTVHYIKTKNHLGTKLFQYTYKKPVRASRLSSTQRSTLFSKISTNLCIMSLRCHWKTRTRNPHFVWMKKCMAYIENVDRVQSSTLQACCFSSGVAKLLLLHQTESTCLSASPC